jgi:predicted lipid-binding transport protein (Tim44 family)
LQVLELIVLAVLAAVVLFQLYAVLGRKVGRGPEAATPVAQTPGVLETPRTVTIQAEESASLTGVAALRSRDSTFEPGQFLQGARQAYQLIVKAFAEGDRAVLEPLLAPAVMGSFDAAIREREAAGHTETIEFLQPPRADLESVNVAGDLARAAVRFLAELRSRSKDAQGEGIDDRRTAEVWTFERNLKSRNPNWTLIHVDAAEA